MESYFYSKLVRSGFEDVVSRTVEALKTEGFAIVTEIDLQSKFREKLNINFRKYKILGACNPAFAFEAIQYEEKIGVMLPCNVLVIDKENGMIEISAVDPVASMKAVENASLGPLAEEVKEKLRNAVDLI